MGRYGITKSHPEGNIKATRYNTPPKANHFPITLHQPNSLGGQTYIFGENPAHFRIGNSEESRKTDWRLRYVTFINGKLRFKERNTKCPSAKYRIWSKCIRDKSRNNQFAIQTERVIYDKRKRWLIRKNQKRSYNRQRKRK